MGRNRELADARAALAKAENRNEQLGRALAEVGARLEEAEDRAARLEAQVEELKGQLVAEREASAELAADVAAAAPGTAHEVAAPADFEHVVELSGRDSEVVAEALGREPVLGDALGAAAERRWTQPVEVGPEGDTGPEDQALRDGIKWLCEEADKRLRRQLAQYEEDQGDGG